MLLSATNNQHAIMDGIQLSKSLKKSICIVHTPSKGYEAFLKKEYNFNSLSTFIYLATYKI